LLLVERRPASCEQASQPGLEKLQAVEGVPGKGKSCKLFDEIIYYEMNYPVFQCMYETQLDISLVPGNIVAVIVHLPSA
jgi:hypothetical protein